MPDCPCRLPMPDCPVIRSAPNGNVTIRRAMRRNEVALLRHLRTHRVSCTALFSLAWHNAVEAGQRLLLWSGYHRTYAVLSQMSPDAQGVAPLLILMKGADLPTRFLGSASERPMVRDLVFSDRPPVFADFLNDDLCIEVDLLKQRMEVHIEPAGTQINATVVRIDEE